jgi:alginate O-acetyltransferase complex protein AlgI
MNLTSPLFLFLFLPIFLLLQLISHPKIRFPLVLVASIIFLAAGQMLAIAWLSAILLTGYIIGWIIAQSKKRGFEGKIWVWIGIGLNLALLAFFKFLGAYGESGLRWIQTPEAWINPITGWAAPLGLSYVTFQMISYLVDVGRGNIAVETNFFKLAAYVFFFPKLISGPLVRFKSFSEQIDHLNPSLENVASGTRRFVIGFVKQTLIASQLALVANAAFNLPTPNLEPRFAWLGLAAFTMQIFFDFAGYTDMAIGLGQMIGLRLPENFNYPYVAQSISDFWRRWHMTLTAWFREYVFYPLERRRFRWAGQQLNILIVFFLTGLWHGFNPTFMVWGLLHGLAMALESAGFGRLLKTIWRPLRHLYTLLIVVAGWVFFRSASLPFAFGFIQRLAGNTAGLTLSPFSQTTPLPIIEPSFILALTASFVFCLPLSQIWNQFRVNLEKQRPILFFAFQPLEDIFLLALFILGLAALVSSTFSPNIYARF